MEEKFTASEIISKIKTTIDQEIAVITTNDWTSKDTHADKVSYYTIENLIIENIVTTILDIFTAINGKSRDKAPKAYEWIDKLMKVYEVFRLRANEFLKSEGKMQTELKKEDLKSFESILTFRKTVRDDLSKFDKKLKVVIAEDGEVRDLPFTLKKSSGLPSMSCRVVMEGKYPEILDYIKNKEDSDEEAV